MNYLEYRRKLKLGISETKQEEKPVVKPKQKPIPKVSEKRKQENKEYKKVSHPIWKGKNCEIKSPVCSKKAEGIHHKKGKVSAKDLLDPKFMMAACNRCNTYVEEHPDWATEKGFKISKHTLT